MNRLEGVVSLIDKCNTLCDVGTDHGYVVEMALNGGLCNKAIATDVNKGPLNSAINYLNSVDLGHKVDFRLGNGLKVVGENEADCAIIAGMGGELISTILEESKNVCRRFKFLVLQPMTCIEELRKYLYNNDFTIVEELLIKETHHYYFILKVVNGKCNCQDEIFYEFSKYLYDSRDKLFLEYMKKQIKINEDIVCNLKKSSKCDIDDKIDKVQGKINKIKGLVNSYEG